VAGEEPERGMESTLRSSATWLGNALYMRFVWLGYPRYMHEGLYKGEHHPELWRFEEEIYP
jgi:hypothetical protein